MMAYERLDAWKAGHELALAVYRATEGAAAEDGLRSRLRAAALLAPAKLANGSARHERKAFLRQIDLAAGYLAELGYLLRLARDRGILDRESWQRLHAARGRAAFYAQKLYVSVTQARG